MGPKSGAGQTMAQAACCWASKDMLVKQSYCRHMSACLKKQTLIKRANNCCLSSMLHLLQSPRGCSSRVLWTVG
jgi:hypothetical protein